MATTPPSTHAADTEVAGEQAGRRSRSRVDGDDRWILAIAVLVLAPLVVTLLGLIGAHWHPTFDWALEVLRIGDVGGRHTPFVGVQSRFGWDHPGPLLFWWSAPFHWLFGNTGVLVGIGLLNGAVIAGSVLVARRRGGLPLVAVFAVVLLLLLQGHRVDLLIDPWNPWVAVLPFLCYVLLAWSVAERDDPMLPWLVVVGTFLVQTHVGYAPLVVGLAGIAALGAWRGHGRDAEPRPTLRRDLRRALVVGVVLWIPPFLQQVTGDPGNLGEMLDFFRNPTEPGAGWLTSLRIMANELSLPGPWITGDDLGPLGLGLSRSPAGATLLLGGVAVLGYLAYRRSARGPARLAVVVLGASVLGVVAGSRIVGLLGPYLVRWWWVVVVCLWLSALWSAWALVASTRAARPVLAVAGVAIVVLALLGMRDGFRSEVPLPRESEAVGALTPEVVAALDRDSTYLVNWVESRTLGAVGVGEYLALYDRGYDVRVVPGLSHQWGSRRTAEPESVDEQLFVVADENIALGWEPPPYATVIAHWDPLSQSERARAAQLDGELRASLDEDDQDDTIAIGSRVTQRELKRRGADPASIDEFDELIGRGHAFTVFLAPPPEPPAD